MKQKDIIQLQYALLRRMAENWSGARYPPKRFESVWGQGLCQGPVSPGAVAYLGYLVGQVSHLCGR